MVVDPLERAIGAAVIDAEHASCGVMMRTSGSDASSASAPATHSAAGMPSIVPPSRQQPAAEREVFLAQDDAGAGAAGCQRRRKPGRAAAHDQHVAMRPRLVVVVGIGQPGGATEAGGAADRRLVDRFPELRRPHEGLVVEAGDEDRREQLVDRQDIEAAATASGSGWRLRGRHRARRWSPWCSARAARRCAARPARSAPRSRRSACRAGDGI